tara:strand:+ start:1970 stop:3232 length:1263 start_codon:yes stop_codon:yes gene_type:complete
MFALVDCNSFYASCEKIFRPDLRNKPIVVLSNNDGCIIARSAEAKKMGIKMAQPWYQVKNEYLSNGGIAFSSNYEFYADISNRIMNTLTQICPEIDIYSIDEAFLDLTSFRKNIDLIRFSYDCKKRIEKWIGIPVSIGIAPTRTLSKLANKIAKNDKRFEGVFILEGKEITNHLLKETDISEIWGIGKKLSKRLKQIGINNAFELSRIDPRLAGNNFNVVLERIIRELRGRSCINLNNINKPKKQIMVSRSFGRGITSKDMLREAVSFHANRAAEKLRYEKQKCKLITVFIRSNSFNKKVKQIYASKHLDLIYPTSDSRIIVKSANQILDTIYHEGYEYSKAGVLLGDFVDSFGYQLSFFDEASDTKSSEKLMEVVDEIKLKEVATIGFGNQGFRNTWKMKRQMKSKRYTTNIDEIPSVR